MDQLLDEIRGHIEGTIDFKGQATAERYSDIASISGIALSVLVGFVLQNFEVAVAGIFLTYVAVLVLCLPFSFYRKNPVTWTAL